MLNEAPNFSLKKVGEQSYWSLHDVENKIVMLTFWTSWCPDSIRDLQAKQTLFSTMDYDKMEMVMVHVKGRDPDVDVLDFIKRHRYTFPVIQDEGTKIYDLYKCTSVPTTFLITRDFKIAKKYGDKATMLDIMTGIASLI